MTPDQIRLARAALGLEYKQRSYRNRFLVVNSTPDYRDWRAMVDAGLASREAVGLGGTEFFKLTRAGAEAVLRPGETLDPEDFP